MAPTKLRVPEHVRVTVTEPMTALKSPPFGCTDVNLALNQYGAMLAPFSQKALAKAWEAVIGSWGKDHWPDIASIVKEARRWATDNQRPVGESLAGYVNRRAPLMEKNYYLGHPKVCEAARAEGWWLDLSGAVRERASALAVAEYQSQPNVADQVVVTQADIEKFRHRATSRRAQYERVAKGEDRAAAVRLGAIAMRIGARIG